MNSCDTLHELFSGRVRFHYPFEKRLDSIPRNGIYVLFEKGERYRKWDRIVRVGTHTGDRQLRSRLHQHYIAENKDRSIFRKNIGRAILNRDQNPYLEIWDRDMTTIEGRKRFGHLVDRQMQQGIEKQVSAYIRENISFVVFELPAKDERLFWESRIISTIASCAEFQSSPGWLGRFSPKQEIRESGLWLVNELHKQPLTARESARLESIVHAD